MLRDVKFLWILPLLAGISSFSQAQSNFEVLVSWNDTSVSGLYGQELRDGTFLVLSNNQYYYPGPGILIEGPPTYGNGLIKISQHGSELWKHLYRNVSGGTSIQPAASFFPTGRGIIIPFFMHVGLMFCDSLPGTGGIFSFSYKTGIMRADSQTGNLLDLYLYNEDTLCSRTLFKAFAILNDSTTIAIETALRTRYVRDTYNSYISVRTIPVSLISQYSIDTNYSIEGGQRGSSVFNPSDTSFTISTYYKPSLQRKIVQINSRGKITDVFNYYIPKWHYSYYFEKYNRSYYFIVENLDSMNSRFVNSYILKYSESGNFEQQLDLYDSKIVDLDITSDGNILLLGDKSKGYFDDSIPVPVRVYLLDADLSMVQYRDFGFSYVNPSHIATTSNNGFIVTGTLLKDMIDEDIREPNQVYFLKSHIDSIDKVWTDIPVNNAKNQESVKIYPNPCSENFTVEFEIQSISLVQFSIYDYMGKRVRKMDMGQLQKGKYKEDVSVNDFKNGVYLFNVSTNGRLHAIKIMKFTH